MTDTGLLLALLGVPSAAGAASGIVRGATALRTLAALSHLATLGLAFALAGRVLAAGRVEALAGWLSLDPLGAVVMLVVAVVSALAAIYSDAYLGHELREGAVAPRELRKYFGLFHAFVFTMLLATTSGNLALLWTAVSATTLASAPLVDFYGSHEPLEAAWKYIVLTVAGSLIALLGFLVLYQSGVGVLGRSYDFTFVALAGSATRLTAGTAAAAFMLVLVGFGAKAGLAPMHAWLPDAHSQAPSPICAMLSGAELNCAMLAILRVYALTAPAAGTAAPRAGLLAFGLLSMVVGVVFLISQRDFKRLLAYSSIEQMGLIATGVSVGAPLALVGALLQMITHGLGKALMFFATGNLLLRFRTTSIDQVRGVVRLMPATAVLLVVGGLAIAGAPPFGLFVSEFSIVSGALRAGQWAVAAAAAGLLLLGFLALLAPFNRMTFSTSRGPAELTTPRLGRLALIPGFLLLAALLLLGVWVPAPLEQLLRAAAAVVGP
jgi:hydrogenase-4 component F